MTDKLDEATIRACIAALPDPMFRDRFCFRDAINESLAALEALLPKRDPAEVLLEEWADNLGEDDDWSKLAFIRWLIDNDRVKG